MNIASSAGGRVSTFAVSGAFGFWLTSRKLWHPPSAPNAPNASSAPNAAEVRVRFVSLIGGCGSEDGADADDDAARLRVAELTEVLAAGVRAAVGVAFRVAEREVAPHAEVAPRDEHRRVLHVEAAQERLRHRV